MESKEAYKAKIDAQLKEWAVKIADLKAKAEVAEASMKVEYLKQVEALHVMREKAHVKLEELKKAGDEKWETLKKGMEKAAAELKDSINSTIAKFK